MRYVSSATRPINRSKAGPHQLASMEDYVSQLPLIFCVLCKNEWQSGRPRQEYRSEIMKVQCATFAAVSA